MSLTVSLSGVLRTSPELFANGWKLEMTGRGNDADLSSPGERSPAPASRLRFRSLILLRSSLEFEHRAWFRDSMLITGNLERHYTWGTASAAAFNFERDMGESDEGVGTMLFGRYCAC